jgi:predicted dienelactone hydrolase
LNRFGATSIRFEDVFPDVTWLKGEATNRKDLSMKRLLLALALLLPVNSTMASADTGLNLFSIPAPHHGRDIDMAILYPSEGGTSRPLGENGVFYGVPVHDYAKLVPGTYPVILMSHGWGGNFMRMGWLSAGLVAKGAIVVAVNHPNSTTGDTNNTSALNHWTRAQDLRAALDHVLQDPQFAASIDSTRIYATGFSYGGWTALSLGGLTGQRDGLDKFCHDGTKVSSHCEDILKAGIDISRLDGTKWQASYKDTRIAAVAAIDPALTMGLSETDVKQLDVPVLLIGLGEGESRLLATDTSARGSNFEALFPEAKVEHIVPATHFTALGLCKPEGEAILKEEKDDPVCSDPAGTDRKAVMKRIIDRIALHFNLD